MKPEIDQEMQEHIDELREIPCGRGHSRHDAYLCFDKRGNPFLGCKQCSRERYATTSQLRKENEELKAKLAKQPNLARLMAGR